MTKLKIIIGSPYNVHRVSYLSEDLEWKGEDTLRQFTIGERLGRGGFAQVHVATHVPTQTKLAVKIFSSSYHIDGIGSEISILRECRHDNVVSYFGYVAHNHKLYVMMELCEAGSLHDLIVNAAEKLKEAHIAYIMRSTLLALRYLHGKNILHRDIKSANILLKRNGILKLTDFGISERIRRRDRGEHGEILVTPDNGERRDGGSGGSEALEEKKISVPPSTTAGAGPASSSTSTPSSSTHPTGSSSSAFSSPPASPSFQPPSSTTNSPPTQPSQLRYGDEPPTMGGTPLWMSPEALRGEAVDYKSDVWSLGITAIEIAEGKPPHNDEKTFVGVALAVEVGDSPSLKRDAPSYEASDMYCDFVDRCLKKDPKERWSVEELLNHPFVTQPFLSPHSSFRWPSPVPTTPTAPPSSATSALSSLFSLGRHTPSHTPSHLGTSPPPSPQPLSPSPSSEQADHKSKKKRPFLSFLRRSPHPTSLSPHLSPSVSPLSPSGRLHQPNVSPPLPPTRTDTPPPSSSSSAILPADLPEASASFVAYINSGSYSASVRSSTHPSLSFNSPSLSGLSVVASPSSHSSRHFSLHSPKLPSSPRGATSELDLPPRPVLSSSHRLSLDAAHVQNGAGASSSHQRGSLTPGRQPAGATSRRRNSLGGTALPSQLDRKAKDEKRTSLNVLSPAELNNDSGMSSLPPPHPSSNMSLPPVSPRLRKGSSGDEKEAADVPPPVSPRSPLMEAATNALHALSLTMSPRTAKVVGGAMQSPTMANFHAQVMEDIRQKSARSAHQPTHETDEDECDECDEPAAHESERVVKQKKPRKREAFMRYLKSKLMAEVREGPGHAKRKHTAHSHPHKVKELATTSHSPTGWEQEKQKQTVTPATHSPHAHHHHHHHHHHPQHQQHSQHQHHHHQHNMRELLTSAPHMAHTKSAPATNIPKLQSYKGLRLGAEKSLQTAAVAFSSFFGDDVDQDKERLIRLREKEEERLKEEENSDKLRSVMERMAGKKKSTVSFAPSVMDRRRIGGMMGMGGGLRPSLTRSKKMRTLDTTIEEELEEEDEDAEDTRTSNNSSALNLHSLAASPDLPSSSSTRPAFALPSLSLQADADEAGDAAASTSSTFSLFSKSRKPGLSLNLTSRESVEDEEATIDVFDGASAPSNAAALRPRGLPSLALSGDDEDNSGSEFNPQDTYSISSHGTLNLAQFKINSHGIVSGNYSGPTSKQSSPRESVGGEQPEEGGIVMLSETDGSGDASSTIPSTSHAASSTAATSSPDAVEQMLRKEDLVEIGICGKGQNGVVKKALHLPTLTRVALKTHVIYDKSTRHQLLHELTAYTRLQSQYLVSFLGAYHDSGSIIMATEFMDQGSLQSFQRRKAGQLNERIVCDIVWRALQGLQFLHANYVVHRDIKPDNFLANSRGEIKLADFGISRQLTDTHAVTDTFLGTLAYLSPERLMSNQYSYAADIWAMGLIVIFLLTGGLGMDTTDYWKMVANINAVPSLDSSKYSREAADFVSLCLKVEPEERPTAEQLLEHDWMKQREDTAGDGIWKGDLEDLDVILSLIIERHLMPSVDSGIDLPPLIQQHSAPVALHITDGQHVTLEQYSASAPSSMSNMPHVSSMPHISPSQSPSPSSSPSPLPSPASASPAPSPASAAFLKPSLIETYPLPVSQHASGQPSAASPTGSIPPAAAAVPFGVSALPEAPSIPHLPGAGAGLDKLRIDVSSKQRSPPLSRMASTDSLSSPNSSSQDEASPTSPSSAAVEMTVIVLDPERAEWLAEQFGVSKDEVQERFQRLWAAKASERDTGDIATVPYPQPQHSV